MHDEGGNAVRFFVCVFGGGGRRVLLPFFAECSSLRGPSRLSDLFVVVHAIPLRSRYRRCLQP